MKQQGVAGGQGRRTVDFKRLACAGRRIRKRLVVLRTANRAVWRARGWRIGWRGSRVRRHQVARRRRDDLFGLLFGLLFVLPFCLLFCLSFGLHCIRHVHQGLAGAG